MCEIPSIEKKDFGGLFFCWTVPPGHFLRANKQKGREGETVPNPALLCRRVMNQKNVDNRDREQEEHERGLDHVTRDIMFQSRNLRREKRGESRTQPDLAMDPR